MRIAPGGARARRRVAAAKQTPASAGDVAPLASPTQRQRRRQWARLIAKVFEVDPLRCTCGATMRIIAFILDPTVITKILEHRPWPEARAHAPPSG